MVADRNDGSVDVVEVVVKLYRGGGVFVWRWMVMVKV